MAFSYPRTFCYDVVIVGARVAGASAALHLSRQGLKVLVVEREAELGPAFSSHQMSIVGSDCLHQWGLYDELIKSDCPGMREVVFDIGDVSVTTAVRPLGEISQLHYCKRSFLDGMLIRHAASAGARVDYETRFLHIAAMDDDGVSINVADRGTDKQRTVRTRFLIGADGRASGVARAMRATPYRALTDSAIMCFAYYDGLLTTQLEMYLRNHKTVALFPTSDGQSCVVLAHQKRGHPVESLDKHALLQAAIRDIPNLATRLGGQAPIRVYRFNGADTYFREPYLKRCALIGDAGYFRDPIVGEGISDAMLSAELLAVQVSKVLQGACVENCMETFKQARDAHFGDAYERTRKLLRFDKDYEGLNEHVRHAARGPSVLQKVVSGFAGGARRTRQDLFDTLSEVEERNNAPLPTRNDERTC